jgi:hypothetical protein
MDLVQKNTNIEFNTLSLEPFTVTVFSRRLCCTELGAMEAKPNIFLIYVLDGVEWSASRSACSKPVPIG